ncbi:MAG: HAMP domain-containing protein [Desulfobacterales bacterium]|nr:HAMP domain-containing protein [Desulfobacterales bacterium]
MNKATREIVEFLVVLSAFFLVLVVVFSRGIRSMIIVPVRKLLAGTREVGLGNLEVRIEHRSRDEMMTLIDGFNTMIRNLKAHEQELAEMSKKVAWTEMARKVAHEIKNPLTPIQLSAEHVLKVAEDDRGDLKQGPQGIDVLHHQRGRAPAPDGPGVHGDRPRHDGPDGARRPAADPRGGPPAVPAAPVRAHPLHGRGRRRGFPGPRRRRQAQDGLPQRRRQRRRGHQPAGRDDGDDRPPRSGPRRRGPRQRAGHEPGDGRTRLRSVLLHQGRRHRPRPPHHQEDRRGARRRDPRRDRARPRHDGRDRAPGRRLTRWHFDPVSGRIAGRRDAERMPVDGQDARHLLQPDREHQARRRGRLRRARGRQDAQADGRGGRPRARITSSSPGSRSRRTASPIRPRSSSSPSPRARRSPSSPPTARSRAASWPGRPWNTRRSSWPGTRLVGTFSCRGKVSMKALEVLMQSPEHEAWADMAASAATHPDESDLEDARAFARWIATLGRPGPLPGPLSLTA